MDRADRGAFFVRYAFGLTMIVGVYLLVTVLRGIRSDFATEIWEGLGRVARPEDFARSEALVMLGVLATCGATAILRDNRRAFFAAMAVATAGLGLVALAALGGGPGPDDPFAFMVISGLGLYLPYVAVHTTIFERLMAMTRDRGNIGYLMYVADAFGYIGLRGRRAGRGWLRWWPTAALLPGPAWAWWPCVASVLLAAGWIWFAAGSSPGPTAGEAGHDRWHGSGLPGAGAAVRVPEFGLCPGRGRESSSRSSPARSAERPAQHPRPAVGADTVDPRPRDPRAGSSPSGPRRAGRDAAGRDAAGREIASPGRSSPVAAIASIVDRDLPQKCERWFKYGHEPSGPAASHGGLADHCLLVPGTTIFRVPDAVPDAVACPASCTTATVAAVSRTAGGLEGRAVLVLGAGMLGLTACAMARESGATEVICVDPDPGRLGRSEAFGATRPTAPGDLASTVARATSGYGVNVAMELSGSPEAFESGLPRLRIGGTYVLAGAVFPTRPVPLVIEQVVRRQANLRGVHNYAPEDLRRAVRFLESATAYPFAELVSDWFPLEDAEAAFRKAREPGVLRVGVLA